MARLEAPDDRFYLHRSLNGNVLVLTSIEKLLLTQQILESDLPYWLVQGDKDIEIHAQVVLLYGELRLPGHNLKIVARRIEILNGPEDRESSTTISVDGEDGKQQQWPPVPLPPTKSAQAPRHKPGISGVNGRPGRSGDFNLAHKAGNAGSITLVTEELLVRSPLLLSARGGKGNAGEDGQPGGAGGDAGCQMEHNGFTHLGDSGHTALPGGNGGYGGAGGDSGIPGEGGRISIFWVKHSEKKVLTTKVDPGSLGQPGNGGKGGAGGLGGFGFGRDDPGNPLQPWGDHSWMRGREGVSQSQARAGAVSGATPASWSTKGGANATKAGIVDDRQISYADYLGHVHAAHLSMLVDEAKADYLAERLDEARDAFGFLQSVLAPLAEMKEAGAITDFTALRRLLGVVAPFVDGLDNRMGYRLDFFHNDYDYVPLVSYSRYIEASDEQLTSLKILEDANKKYLDALHTGADTQHELNKVKESARAALEERRDELKAAWTEIGQVAANLTSADRTLVRTRKTMESGLAELKRKIVAYQKCLSFDDICRAVEMCAFVPPTGGAGIAMASLQSYQLISKGLGLTDNDGGLNKSFMIRQLDRLSGTEPRQALKEGYTANKGLFSLEEPNAVKMLADAELLDEMLVDLESAIPSARDCRRVIQDYVVAVTAHNDLILRYNEIGYSILHRQSEISELEGQISNIDEQVTHTLNPALPAVFASISHLCRATRDRVLKTLYLASRAHMFLRLAESRSFRRVLSESNVKRIDYAVLIALQSDIKGECILALEEARRDLEPFPPIGHEETAQALLLNDDEHVAALREGSLSFSISLEMGKTLFRGQRNVRIREVRPWIVGLKLRTGLLKGPIVVNDCVSVKVVRDGTLGDTFIAPEGARKRLIYNAVETHFLYPIKHPCDSARIQQKATLTTQEYDDGTYALVGPFGYWRLQLDDVDRYDFSEVTGIKLEFFGASY